MKHIQSFASEYITSTNLQVDRPRAGHFRTSFSADTLCWTCGSSTHAPKHSKMITAAVSDYKSKYLHRNETGGYRPTRDTHEWGGKSHNFRGARGVTPVVAGAPAEDAI